MRKYFAGVFAIFLILPFYVHSEEKDIATLAKTYLEDTFLMLAFHPDLGDRIYRLAMPATPRVFTDSGCLFMNNVHSPEGKLINRGIKDAISSPLEQASLGEYYKPEIDKEHRGMNERLSTASVCKRMPERWPHVLDYYIVTDKEVFKRIANRRKGQKGWFIDVASKVSNNDACNIALKIENHEIRESEIVILSDRVNTPTLAAEAQLACLIRGSWASLGLVGALRMQDSQILSKYYYSGWQKLPEESSGWTMPSLYNFYPGIVPFFHVMLQPGQDKFSALNMIRNHSIYDEYIRSREKKGSL